MTSFGTELAMPTITDVRTLRMDTLPHLIQRFDRLNAQVWNRAENENPGCNCQSERPPKEHECVCVCVQHALLPLSASVLWMIHTRQSIIYSITSLFHWKSQLCGKKQWVIMHILRVASMSHTHVQASVSLLHMLSANQRDFLPVPNYFRIKQIPIECYWGLLYKRITKTM